MTELGLSSNLAGDSSVLRHLRINAIGPGGDAAGQVIDFGESGAAEEVYGFGAAAAHLTMSYYLAAGVEFTYSLG